MALSRRQIEVLDFIKKFIATNGYSPTVREIASGLYLKSPSTVQDHLKKLVANGIITINQKKSRTIELLVQNEYIKEDSSIAKIPILESEPEAVAREFLDIPAYMLNGYDSKNLYTFKSQNSIYLINASLTRVNKPSVVEKDGKFVFDENPSKGVFGNVIGEFRVY